MPRFHLLLAALGLPGLAACAPGAGPAPTPVAADPCPPAAMVSPASNRLDPTCADQAVSLAALVEDRLGGRLDANDRRFIDGSFDAAFLDAPGAAPRRWSNPATGDEGSVGLQSWVRDPRRDELCGIVGHEGRIGTDRLEGTVTLCRAAFASGWRLDQQSWRELPPTTAKAAPAAKPRTVTVVRKPAPAQPPVVVVVPEPSPPPPVVVIQKPATTVTPAPTGGVPDQPGQTNVGDLLQDRGPATPAR